MKTITYNGITVNIDDAVLMDVRLYIAQNEVLPSYNMAGAAAHSAPAFGAPLMQQAPMQQASAPSSAAPPAAKHRKGIFSGFKLSTRKGAAAQLKEESSDIATPALAKEDVCYDMAEEAVAESTISADAAIDDILSNVEDTFQTHLLKLIDKRDLSDSEVYKKADIDRRHFSKIRSNPEYRPKKQTAVALALALELNLDEAVDLLGRAGYAFSPSNRADLIARYCIEHKIYDLMEVNALLFYYDQPLLGGQGM